MSKIGLDGKHVGHIAVVIARPNVLVTAGIDQLHVDPHLIAGAPNAALENVRNAKSLANLANVRRLTAILHHRRA